MPCGSLLFGAYGGASGCSTDGPWTGVKMREEKGHNGLILTRRVVGWTGLTSCKLNDDIFFEYKLNDDIIETIMALLVRKEIDDKSK